MTFVCAESPNVNVAPVLLKYEQSHVMGELLVIGTGESGPVAVDGSCIPGACRKRPGLFQFVSL
jgi:hypothetical protein